MAFHNQLVLKGMVKKMNYTLEDFKKMKLVSNTEGRPPENMTDEKWQQEIKYRKIFISPYKDITRLSARECRGNSASYHGETQWTRYAQYINSVLKNIRSGQVDYCYYIYQIIELLKFHYDDLRTKYHDGYWEVWLEQ